MAPGEQSLAICKQLGDYRYRKGFLAEFEKSVALIHANSSAGQFEQALVDLAFMIGLSGERFDENGKGPDLMWLLPGNVGWVIVAKNRKKEKNALTKDDHGQLLVACEWFRATYPGYKDVRVSVLPTNQATSMAEAQGAHALTFEKLAALVSDARVLLESLCGSQLPDADLVGLCEGALATSPLRADRIGSHYLLPFVTR